jgi:hypothetical protein
MDQKKDSTNLNSNNHVKDNFEWWVIEGKTHLEILELFRLEYSKRPWCRYFLNDNPMYPGNLNSKCRIGYVPFDNCIQDHLYYIDKSRNTEMIASGGIVTHISWDFDSNSLPKGWQGTVRRSFYDNKDPNKKPNTLVALLAFTPNRYRGKGFSRLMLSKMCAHAKSKGYRFFIVPALPPSQFEKDKVQLSMTEISNVKREDGKYYDYWLRLHAQKGAKITGFCDTSHRFILNLKDFSQYVSSTPIKNTGEHVIQLDRDKSLGINNKSMWEKVYGDIKRDFVTFNWGCVWMKYEIDKLDF